jgi:hypothetical protein
MNANPASSDHTSESSGRLAWVNGDNPRSRNKPGIDKVGRDIITQEFLVHFAGDTNMDTTVNVPRTEGRFIFTSLRQYISMDRLMPESSDGSARKCWLPIAQHVESDPWHIQPVILMRWSLYPPLQNLDLEEFSSFPGCQQ